MYSSTTIFIYTDKTHRVLIASHAISFVQYAKTVDVNVKDLPGSKNKESQYARFNFRANCGSARYFYLLENELGRVGVRNSYLCLIYRARNYP